MCTRESGAPTNRGRLTAPRSLGAIKGAPMCHGAEPPSITSAYDHNSGSGKKEEGKRWKRVKKIVYYDSDSSSSLQKDNDGSSSIKNTVNQNYSKSSFNYSCILTIRMLIYYLFLLASLLILTRKIILGGVIKYGIIYFLFILAFGIFFSFHPSIWDLFILAFGT
jgi:hypothetical protein